MEFSSNELIMLSGTIGGFFAYGFAFAYFMGSLRNRVDNNEKDIKGISERVTKEIAVCKVAVQEEFHNMCNSKQEVWQVTLKGLIETRALTDERNFDEHKTLFKILETLDGKLDELADCLHKHQNDKEC